MAEKDMLSGLKGRTQAELEEIETEERANGARPEVLAKLRYLRGPQPLEGYDDMESEQVVAAIEGANAETLRLVREYERKFRRRIEVLDAVERIGRPNRVTPHLDASREGDG